MPKTVKKIIWGMDPLERESETQVQVCRALNELTRATGYKIQPCFVMSPLTVGLAEEFPSRGMRRYLPAASQLMKQAVEDQKLENVLPVHILHEKKATVTSAARKLASFAKKDLAPFIVVGTHSRKGIDRFVLGSFAETLILESKIPTLVIPHHASHFPVRTILFATDFEQGSENVFKRTLVLARQLKCKITLFHAISNPQQALFSEGIYLLSGAAMSLPEYMTNREQIKSRLAHRFALLGKHRSVDVKVVIGSAKQGIAHAVLEATQQYHCDMIAMGAQSGTLKSALIGSVTRQVIRNSPCPIWIERE